MQSILIISDSQEGEKKQLLQLLKGIDPFDITLIESQKAIGIEEIRTLKKNIFYKPLKGNRKGVLVNVRDGITHQAQNALLKILEEPPPYALIILVGPSKELFLPTVLSRCRIMEIRSNYPEMIKKDNQNNYNLLDLFSKSIKLKLKVAQDHGATRQDAITITERMIEEYRVFLLQSIRKGQEVTYYQNALNRLQDGYELLSTTNLNPRFVLEWTLLIPLLTP